MSSWRQTPRPPGERSSHKAPGWVACREAFLRPVSSLLRTSRRTRGASTAWRASRNRRTASGSQTTSSRSAHDSAPTTMSSRSAASRWQMSRVRLVSPVPPLDRRLSGTVETRAARRHHRSGDAAQLRMIASGRCSCRHAGPRCNSRRRQPTPSCPSLGPAAPGPGRQGMPARRGDGRAARRQPSAVGPPAPWPTPRPLRQRLPGVVWSMHAEPRGWAGSFAQAACGSGGRSRWRARLGPGRRAARGVCGVSGLGHHGAPALVARAGPGGTQVQVSAAAFSQTASGGDRLPRRRRRTAHATRVPYSVSCFRHLHAVRACGLAARRQPSGTAEAGNAQCLLRWASAGDVEAKPGISAPRI
jgi:hypothetical protein